MTPVGGEMTEVLARRHFFSGIEPLEHICYWVLSGLVWGSKTMTPMHPLTVVNYWEFGGEIMKLDPVRPLVSADVRIPVSAGVRIPVSRLYGRALIGIFKSITA